MGTKILVVDDNEDIRFSVKIGLESLNKGYGVMSADGGEEALDILKKFRPDVILMDIMMPGLDGFDTSIKIKETPELRDIPLVFLSAKTDGVSKGTAGVVGEYFLEKPCGIEDIEKIIIEIVKNK